MEPSGINEDLKINAEQSDERRKILDELMMQEPIRSVPPRQPPICVQLGESVSVAVQKMNENKVGCVLVTEGERLVGIVTERNILRRLMNFDRDPKKVKVEEIMTRNPEVLQLDDPIVFALNKMGVGGFRHLPLVDNEHRPVGTLSVQHIVRYIVEFFASEVLNLPPAPGKDIPQTREGA